jgi:hypothetical protein
MIKCQWSTVAGVSRPDKEALFIGYQHHAPISERITRKFCDFANSFFKLLYF